MTILIDKPIFTCAERDRVTAHYVKDVLSFIHLVRLNLPVILIQEASDMEKDIYSEAYCRYFDRQEGRYVHWKKHIEFEPKNSRVIWWYGEPCTHRGRMYISKEYNVYCLPREWDELLESLRGLAGTAEIRDYDMPTFKSATKTKEGWVLEGFPFPITNEDMYRIVRQKPWAFAPSPKFKSRADSVHSAKDLPFELA